MVAIIDYDTGNLRSVMNALERAGVEYVVTADHEVLRRADKILLPGVGEASSAMEKLRERGLVELIPTLTQPMLGICIGMQLMCESSEEGDAKCLGIFSTRVKKLPPAMPNGELLKVPHVGWDTIEGLKSKLFEGIKESSHIYYVHSFAAEVCNQTIATTDYGRLFSASLHRDNFYGTQFHPEKSGSVGEQILANFLKL
ncbi:MAG: imidazole glycerol phosphate synthase subunit HisH [Rikenellaceae bacterium]